jgi:acetyl esterase/lipase
MSFADMPDLGPMQLPGATEYAAQALAWSRAVVAETRNLIDIPYGPDFFQKLDVFLPREAVRNAPVIFFLHGGAWQNGFKEWMGFMAPPLLSFPAIFVTANYRLAPGVKYPVPVDDCWLALRWIVENIARHGGDPERIYVGGHSAGGHVAALLALRPDQAAAHGLKRDVAKGCLLVSASLSLDLADAAPGSRRAKMMRTVLAHPEDGPDGTAFSHVAGTTIPVYIAYGANDQPELIEQNERLIGLLGRERCVVERTVFPGADHFATNLACRDADGVWVRTVRRLVR